MVDASAQGFLQLKQVTNAGDTWTTYFAEYDAPTRTLTCKSEDSKLLFASFVVDGVWSLERKAGRRGGRFDVLISDGATVAFAAAKEKDMKHWVKVRLVARILA